MGILYGLLNMADLKAKRVTEVGVAEVTTALDMTLAEHNRQMNLLMAAFVRPTTDFKGVYRTAANARLQPLDNNGRARPIKPAGQYDLAWPILQAGAAWGWNDVTAKKARVGDVAEIVTTITTADRRWMRDHLLAALFYENGTTPLTFVDEEHGSLSVYGLANGDSVTYHIISGADAAATDDHVKGAASLTAAVFTDVKNELMEHPENGGQVVVFVPTASRSTVEGLTGFYPKGDPNLQMGSGSTVLVGPEPTNIPGEIFGYIEGCWVAEWRSLPDNYLVGITTEGERPIAMRQDEEAELQGFNFVAERDDYPYYERQYRRRAGFGAWNRVGAIVYRTDNSTYAIPTGYGSWMP